MLNGSSAMPPLATERAWCREALLRVSRTFALNIRCLSGRMLESVRLAYLLCRAADALEDSWPGPPAEMAARFDALVGALEGDDAAAMVLASGARALHGRADAALLVRLPALLRVLGSLDERDAADIRGCVRTMALGMKRFATRAAGRGNTVPYIDDDAELHEYCYVVAGCVGEMLTRLLGHGLAGDDAALAARRLALAPVVGEALQLTNILLDWPADVRRGRCYLPAAWLAEHGLSPADLVRAADAGADATPKPGVREIVARIERLARAALAQVPSYVALIPRRHWRYRLFCLWPALWASDSLDHARSDADFPWGARRPRLPRPRLWSAAWRSALGLRGAASLARGSAPGVIASPASPSSAR